MFLTDIALLEARQLDLNVKQAGQFFTENCADERIFMIYRGPGFPPSHDLAPPPPLPNQTTEKKPGPL